MEPFSPRTIERLRDEWKMGREDAFLAQEKSCFSFCYGFLRKCQVLELVRSEFTLERALFDMGYNFWMPLEFQEWFMMPDFSNQVPDAMPLDESEEYTDSLGVRRGQRGWRVSRASERVGNDESPLRWSLNGKLSDRLAYGYLVV